jgi:hypothetical protein
MGGDEHDETVGLVLTSVVSVGTRAEHGVCPGSPGDKKAWGAWLEGRATA